MKKQTSTTVLLAIIQVLCLAFGLWLQDKFLIQASTWQERNSKGSAGGESTATAVAEPEVTARSLLGNMPQTRVLTLIWTGGLQMVTLFLVISRLRTDHSKKDEQSELKLLRRERDLVRTRNAVIFGLANLAESRDHETGQHLERIALYSTRLASALRSDARFLRLVSPNFVKSIGISSALHDIGKVGVPDAVLLKPGPLTDEERRQMQEHSQIGSDCIERIERRLGSSNFLHMARQIALHHHERWDGNGYPYKLAEREIPLAARIVAVADMYDALSVKRVYKAAFPHSRCIEIIRQEAGKQLDPDIVDVFLSIEHEFEDIARRFDGSTDPPGRVRSIDEPVRQASQESDQNQLIEAVLDYEESITGTPAEQQAAAL